MVFKIQDSRFYYDLLLFLRLYCNAFIMQPDMYHPVLNSIKKQIWFDEMSEMCVWFVCGQYFHIKLWPAVCLRRRQCVWRKAPQYKPSAPWRDVAALFTSHATLTAVYTLCLPFVSLHVQRSFQSARGANIDKYVGKWSRRGLYWRQERRRRGVSGAARSLSLAVCSVCPSLIVQAMMMMKLFSC